ncbi:MAG: hypothetical protein AXW13_00030 [Alcanivorax sp. Nap_24]|nr:MAG: hypothetical protein AXW13_00030 [Alcanivorax sp. Nap_24]
MTVKGVRRVSTYWLLLLLALGLTACGGGSSSSDDRQANNPPAPSEPEPEPEPPTEPEPEPEPQALNRFQFANGCYHLYADGRYLSGLDGRYGVTLDPGRAASFYMKPTALGSYLLLSDYRRDPGQAGDKELLGISDPAGELLDGGGRLIAEVSYLVAGLVNDFQHG